MPFNIFKRSSKKINKDESEDATISSGEASSDVNNSNPNSSDVNGNVVSQEDQTASKPKKIQDNNKRKLSKRHSDLGGSRNQSALLPAKELVQYEEKIIEEKNINANEDADIPEPILSPNSAALAEKESQEKQQAKQEEKQQEEKQQEQNESKQQTDENEEQLQKENTTKMESNEEQEEEEEKKAQKSEESSNPKPSQNSMMSSQATNARLQQLMNSRNKDKSRSVNIGPNEEKKKKTGQQQYNNNDNKENDNENINNNNNNSKDENNAKEIKEKRRHSFHPNDRDNSLKDRRTSKYNEDNKSTTEDKNKTALLDMSNMNINVARIQYRVKNEIFVLYEYYEPIRILGSGAYAVVCEAIDKRNQQHVAIKKNKGVFDHIIDARRILREIKLLMYFKHKNIIDLINVIPPENNDIETFNDVYLVMPRIETNLSKVIRSKQKLTDRHNQFFIYQLLCGIKYIHSSGVIHRDLKPENILINGNDCSLKITDFGLARGVSKEENIEKPTEYVVTRWYRSPEVMCSAGLYDEKVDIWSIGCIFAELIIRRPLFPGQNYLDQLKLIFDIMGTPKSHDWIKTPEAKKWVLNLQEHNGKDLKKLLITNGATPISVDLCLKMLELNPNQRISAVDSIQHLYLKDLRKPNEEITCPLFDLSFEFEKAIKTKFGVRHMMYDALLSHTKQGSSSSSSSSKNTTNNKQNYYDNNNNAQSPTSPDPNSATSASKDHDDEKEAA